MLQLILSPLRGWEDVEADGFDSHTLLRRGLIPFLAFTAVTVWAGMLYYHEGSPVAFLEQMSVCFIKYFATYYLAMFFFTLYIPTCIDSQLSLEKCSTFINYGVGLLALINIIENLTPPVLALIYILPIYVIFIMWRGLHYMNVSFNGVVKFILLIIFTIVVPPYLIQYLFNFIIPAI